MRIQAKQLSQVSTLAKALSSETVLSYERQCARKALNTH